MRVLVTGAAGFVGSHLAEACEARGDAVVGIDNFSTGRRDNWSGMIIEQDIAAPLPTIPADLIFHCAASYRDRNDWERDARTNVLGTINVVRLAQQTGAKLVYFQTSLCYGPHPVSPITLDAPLDPHGSYATSKTAAERYIEDSGVPYVSLRLANIYGPRNLSGPVPTFYMRLSQGQPCTVVDSRRDFVYVDDLVTVALAAADRGSGVYHVASGGDVAIRAIFDEVAMAMDEDDIADPITQPRGTDDVATILLDPSRAESEFGWRVSTPLSVGIDRAVAWYREHGVAETWTHLSVKG